MSLAPRLIASFVVAVSAAAPVVLAWQAASDAGVEGESATSVIAHLQEQGYVVDVNGAPAGDTSLLTTCTVTSIHNPGDPAPDATTKTVNVDVACPITHA